MNITEEPLSAFELSEIERDADEALNVLGRDLAMADPAKVVHAIDNFAYRWQQGETSACEAATWDDDDDERAASTLGSLWGEQLVKQFGWQWAKVIFHDYDGASMVGVFSPDRSLAIYPFDFLLECMESLSMDVTVMLTFNMLLGQKIPKAPEHSYDNVMEGIHRIVPRG